MPHYDAMMVKKKSIQYKSYRQYVPTHAESVRGVARVTAEHGILRYRICVWTGHAFSEAVRHDSWCADCAST